MEGFVILIAVVSVLWMILGWKHIGKSEPSEKEVQRMKETKEKIDREVEQQIKEEEAK